MSTSTQRLETGGPDSPEPGPGAPSVNSQSRNCTLETPFSHVVVGAQSEGKRHANAVDTHSPSPRQCCTSPSTTGQSVTVSDGSS